jgi:hypothetical protein
MFFQKMHCHDTQWVSQEFLSTSFMKCNTLEDTLCWIRAGPQLCQRVLIAGSTGPFGYLTSYVPLSVLSRQGLQSPKRRAGTRLWPNPWALNRPVRSSDPARDFREGRDLPGEGGRRSAHCSESSHEDATCVEKASSGAPLWLIGRWDCHFHGCSFSCDFCRRLRINSMWKNGVPSSFELV